MNMQNLNNISSSTISNKGGNKERQFKTKFGYYTISLIKSYESALIRASFYKYGSQTPQFETDFPSVLTFVKFIR